MTIYVALQKYVGSNHFNIFIHCLLHYVDMMPSVQGRIMFCRSKKERRLRL